MIFLALLGRVPLKDWIYCGVIVALLIGFGMFVHHERAVGAARVVSAVEAQTKKLEAANAAANAKQEAAAAAAVKAVGDNYASALKADDASVASLNVRLRNYAARQSSGAALPEDSRTPGESDGPAREPGSVERALEGLTVAASHDADKVIGLQRYITEVCQK